MAEEQRTRHSSAALISHSVASWLLKFCLVLYKHFLIRKHHYVLTFCELLLPILVMLFVLSIGAFSYNAATTGPVTFPKEDPMRGKTSINLEVFYIPKVSYTKDFVTYFKEKIRKTPGSENRRVTFHGLKSEEDFDEGNWPQVKPDIVLIFDEMTSDTVTPNILNCQFILNEAQLDVNWFELDLMTIQHVIALHFMEKIEGYDISQNVTFSMQRFPESPRNPHGVHVVEYSGVYFGVLLPFAFILIIPVLLTQVVMEKESGINELMRVMGLPGYIQWLGYAINTFIIMFISSIVIVVMMTYNIFPNVETIIQKTNEGHLVLIFLLYIFSSIAFCLFLSAMCSRATRATVFGVIVWCLSIGVPFTLTKAITIGGLTTQKQILWSLLPNMNLFWSLRFIGFLEYTNGLEGRYYFESPTIAENMCLFPLLVMFVVDIILYWSLAWYLDAVFPGNFGVPRPWYFLCTILYRLKIKAPAPPAKIIKIDEANFEPEASDLSKVVDAENLRKVFKGFFSRPLVAVDDVSLNVHKGQIFVLLGGNGAGKTVTMSMLAGVFAPTSGTAYIYGYEIRKDLNRARDDIGFCPQEGIIFPELTVKQHFKFFARLKGMRRSLLFGEVNFLLQRLKLWEYRNKRAKELPGGMKRRLQLGIAVIGQVKLIILDEPTSGMDPEARRLVWDLLLEMRTKCCIIITTHFMEEADALADRIAIINHGQIVCSGSPKFLRAKFGADYIMKVTKSPGFDTNKVLKVIKSHAPEAHIDTDTHVEVSFILPVGQKSTFPVIFRDLEAHLDQLNISNFGLSTMSLEEVFLKVNEISEQQSGKPSKRAATHSSKSSVLEEDDNIEADIEITEGKDKLLQQFRGLMMKRVYYMSHRPFFYFWQFTLILATSIVVVLLFHKLGGTVESKNWDEVIFNPRKPLVIFEQHDTTKYCLPDAYTNNIAERVTIRKLAAVPDRPMSDDILEVANEDPIGYNNDNYIMGASFIMDKNEILLANAMYWSKSNLTGLKRFTKMASLNLIHNALLQNCRKEERRVKIKINITTIGTPTERRIKDEQKVASKTLGYKWFAAMVLAIGFCLMASACVYLVAQERITQSKHLQFMTGTTTVLYWATSFLCDYLYYLVCAIICIIILASFCGSIMNMTQVAGITFFALILFGWCVIPFEYLISFCARSAAGAFITVIIINVVSVFIGSALQALWWYYITNHDGEYPVTVDILLVILEFFPGCSFVSILVKLWISAVKFLGPNFQPMSLENKGVGRQLLMLWITGIIYMLLVLVMELRSSRCVRLTVAFLTKTLRDTAPPLAELDVDAEDKRVKDMLYRRYQSQHPDRSATSLASLSSDDVLLVDNLTKRFSAKCTAVDHLTFGVRTNECFGLLGVNGAGKTTTFRMLSGSIIISLGDAYIYDISLRDDRSKFLSQVGYCPQVDALLDHLTAREMLLLFSRLRGVKEDQVGRLTDAFLAKFGLSNNAYELTSKCSPGTRRKLSVALAFLGLPLLVMLDEPTSGVDPMSRRKIWEVIMASKIKGTSIILSSHSMDECEVLCTRLAILKKGQFKCIGGVQHLKAKFGKVFRVVIKLPKFHDVEDKIRVHDETVKFMELNFKNCAIEAEREGVLEYSVPYTSADWHKLFTTMEEAKEKFKWEDYSVCQATLEQVFLAFASGKEEEGDTTA